MKKIAFNLNRFLLRGTQVATYDYADYWEKLYDGESYILGFKNESMDSYPKFFNRFGDRVLLYDRGNMNQVKNLLDERGIDTVYWIKEGRNDGFVCPGKKNLIHTVFQVNEPHGDKYTFIAQWLSEKMTGNKENYIPHILELPQGLGDLREELGIPKNAIVFGRHGGYDEFNIRLVYEPIYKTAKNNPNIYFIFLNTKKFCDDLPNIIHLPGTWDVDYKTKFINTCDALLHARLKGEIFSMTIGEFLIQDKPVISSKIGEDSGHIVMLKDKGIWYNSSEELFNILNTFKREEPKGYYRDLVKEFTPKNVMDRFVKIFEI